MTALSEWLNRVSTGRVALVASVAFVLFVALVLPAQPRIESAGGAGAAEARSPDLSLWYSPDELYEMAEVYGPDGRAAYVRQRMTFDVVWPLVYAAFLGITLSWVFGKLSPAARIWRHVNLLPVAAALFDYLENACTTVVMLRYPARTPVVDLLAPLMTVTKWALLASSFLLLFLGLVLVVREKLRAQQRTPHQG